MAVTRTTAEGIEQHEARKISSIARTILGSVREVAVFVSDNASRASEDQFLY